MAASNSSAAAARATPASISNSISKPIQAPTPAQLFYDTKWDDLRPPEPSAISTHDGRYLLDDWSIPPDYTEDSDTKTAKRFLATDRDEMRRASNLSSSHAIALHSAIQVRSRSAAKKRTGNHDNEAIPKTTTSKSKTKPPPDYDSTPPTMATDVLPAAAKDRDEKPRNRSSNGSKDEKESKKQTWQTGKGKQPAEPTPGRRLQDRVRDTRLLERNRIAANKYRYRKQSQIQLLETEEHDIEDKNRLLHGCFRELSAEVYQLKMQLLQHTECDCVLIQSFLLSSDAKEFSGVQAGMDYCNVPVIHDHDWTADMCAGYMGAPGAAMPTHETRFP